MAAEFSKTHALSRARFDLGRGGLDFGMGLIIVS